MDAGCQACPTPLQRVAWRPARRPGRSCPGWSRPGCCLIRTPPHGGRSISAGAFSDGPPCAGAQCSVFNHFPLISFTFCDALIPTKLQTAKMDAVGCKFQARAPKKPLSIQRTLSSGGAPTAPLSNARVPEAPFPEPQEGPTLPRPPAVPQGRPAAR